MLRRKQKTSAQKKDQSQNVVSSSTKAWLPKVERPDFADTLEFPHDITQLDPAGLTRLMGRYEVLRAYVLFDYADSKQMELDAQTKLKEQISKCSMEVNTGAKTPKYLVDREIESSEEIILLRNILVKAQSLKIRQEAYLEVYERFVSALSRELTRQKGGS